MRRTFQVLAWGVLGAVLATALIGGAFVLAGTSLTEPASAVRVVGPPLRADRPDRHGPDHTPEADGTPDAGNPSPDPAAAGGSSSAPMPTGPGAGSMVPVPGSPDPAASDDGNVERGDD
jgi:hypothetical protein